MRASLNHPSRVFSPLILWAGLLALFFAIKASAANGSDWITAEDVSLVVKSGSPLDFSKWVPPGPAGKQGRVIIGPGGRLHFEKTIEPARFHCASLAWSPATGGFPAGEQADLFARQLRLHGYNLVRFHYVDASLMSGRDDDFDFDREQLERWLYFLAALKREGIYWVMDAMSSENGALGKVYPHRWVPKYDLKQRVHVDPEAQAHWRELSRRLLTLLNPHTGMRVIDDPALVGIVLVNEGGLNYLGLRHQQWPSVLQPGFNRWLASRYAGTSALSKAWGDLAAEESIERNSVQLPQGLRGRSVRMTDFQRFLMETEANTARWMTSYLRGLGYKGLITSHNNWVSTQADAVRSTLEWVDMHGYHDESSSFSPGAQIKQTSSLDDAARYARWLAAARQVGKPYSVTEYGQPFWNRYRFEAGLVVPAMARLQGWDFVCLHAEGAIDLSLRQSAPRKWAIHPYGVGIDPITRAGETLAALLMLRGDVTPARNVTRLDFSGDGAFRDSGVGVVGDDLSTLAWLTSIQTDAGAVARASQGPSEVLRLTADGPADSMTGRLLDRLVGGADARLAMYVERLRRLGVLPAGNLTDVKRGVFQSETGEITLDRQRGFLKVMTPRTEAVVFRAPVTKLDLNVISINRSATEALVAVTALDDAPLAKSRSMLLVFATDAENTGMQFADDERKRLTKLGTMPPRIRRGAVEVFLKTGSGIRYSLRSLRLNGDRGDELPVTAEQGGIRFVMDNGALSHGPTTFFLLEAL